MSTPDRVLPSFINCTAIVEGFDGPFDSSNLALRDPAPGVKHKQINSLATESTSMILNKLSLVASKFV